MTGTNIWMIPSSKYWYYLFEPLKWLKMPTCRVFFCFKIFLSVKPLFCWVIIYLTCIDMHQTKPTSMGIHHVKGFWDTLTYKTYTRCLKCGTNFWTPCSRSGCIPISIELTELSTQVKSKDIKQNWSTSECYAIWINLNFPPRFMRALFKSQLLILLHSPTLPVSVQLGMWATFYCWAYTRTWWTTPMGRTWGWLWVWALGCVNLLRHITKPMNNLSDHLVVC